MERLTVPDKPIEGGLRRAIIDAGAVREDAMKFYWALKKYEDTGLTPEEIMDGKLLTGWILVTEGMPDCEKEVLIVTEKGTITVAMHEDGTIEEEDSVWYWNDIDFNYDEETDTSYIPEGWWEYKHYHPDDVYNYAVDETVVAWMPLPKTYVPERPGRAGKSMDYEKAVMIVTAHALCCMEDEEGTCDVCPAQNSGGDCDPNYWNKEKLRAAVNTILAAGTKESRNRK